MSARNNHNFLVAQEQEIAVQDSTQDLHHDDDDTRLSISSTEYRSSSRISRACKALIGSHKLMAGPATMSRCAGPSSECLSTGIQEMTLEQKNESIGTNLEAEIESSKIHWSELESMDAGAGAAETNLKVFENLQKQWPRGFFKCPLADSGSGFGQIDLRSLVLGKKIGEGGQAEIFKAENQTHGYKFDGYVLKVFKEGSSLEDLQREWPLGMLKNIGLKKEYFRVNTCEILCGMLLKNGRFAFLMYRHWGDLHKLIVFRMQRFHQRTPFSNAINIRCMWQIAKGMQRLHMDDITHRDLKASNVLIRPEDHGLGSDPKAFCRFSCVVADFECSVGVVGTRFWRAPEILLAVKNHDVKPKIFTKQSDVYSYAMTCYEILTGRIPFEDIGSTDYDAVIDGKRPELPDHIRPWLKALLSRCWHCNPSDRPTFAEVVEILEKTNNENCRNWTRRYYKRKPWSSPSPVPEWWPKTNIYVSKGC